MNAEAVLTGERRRVVRARRVRRVVVVLGRIALVAGILVLWDIASGTLIRSFFVSTPQAVGGQLADWFGGSGDFWFHAQFTLSSAGLGFAVGAVLGVGLAWPLALRRTTYRMVPDQGRGRSLPDGGGHRGDHRPRRHRPAAERRAAAAVAGAALAAGRQDPRGWVLLTPQ